MTRQELLFTLQEPVCVHRCYIDMYGVLPAMLLTVAAETYKASADPQEWLLLSEDLPYWKAATGMPYDDITLAIHDLAAFGVMETDDDDLTNAATQWRIDFQRISLHVAAAAAGMEQSHE